LAVRWNPIRPCFCIIEIRRQYECDIDHFHLFARMAVLNNMLSGYGHYESNVDQFYLRASVAVNNVVTDTVDGIMSAYKKTSGISHVYDSCLPM
jgi:hypothetical protein